VGFIGGIKAFDSKEKTMNMGRIVSIHRSATNSDFVIVSNQAIDSRVEPKAARQMYFQDAKMVFRLLRESVPWPMYQALFLLMKEDLGNDIIIKREDIP
jgi:hypothetical protein